MKIFVSKIQKKNVVRLPQGTFQQCPRTPTAHSLLNDRTLRRNSKYPGDLPGRFFSFHQSRRDRLRLQDSRLSTALRTLACTLRRYFASKYCQAPLGHNARIGKHVNKHCIEKPVVIADARSLLEMMAWVASLLSSVSYST